MINKLIFFLFLLNGSLAFSQDLVVLNKTIDLNIDVKGGEFSIKEEHTEVKEILSDHNLGLTEYIYYSALNDLIKFNAKTTFTSSKGKEKTFPVKHWETTSLDQRGTFFTGDEMVTFNYPNTVKGARCTVNYKTEIKEPQFVSNYILGNVYPMKALTIRITFPKHIDVHLELRKTDSLDLDYHSEIIDDIEIHTYTIKNIPEYADIEKLKSYLYVCPQLLVRIKSYKTKAGQVNVGNSVEDLYTWYASLIHKIPVTDSDELRRNLQDKVKNLIQPFNSDSKKVEAIYNWVQKNIKYIAFEDGMNGFIPRNAYQIFDNRYGDCKDMANLIKTMLEYAEIPAYLTWIGTRKKPYTYNDVPSVYTDDHMICTVKLDGDYVFLDGTNSYLPFKNFPEFIQGKQALVGLSDTEFDLVNVPISDHKYTTRRDSLKLTLNQNLLTGKVNTQLSGYMNESLQQLIDLGKSVGKDDFYLRYLKIGNKGCAVENTVLDRDPNLSEIEVNSTFENYIIDSKSKLYIVPTITDFYSPLAVRNLKERHVDLHEDHKYNHKVITQIDIPKGYQLKQLPKPIVFEHPLFSFKQDIRFTDGQIEVEQHLIIDFITLEKRDFAEYASFLDVLKKIQRKKLTLIKPIDE